jgi:hypothetical protein
MVMGRRRSRQKSSFTIREPGWDEAVDLRPHERVNLGCTGFLLATRLGAMIPAVAGIAVGEWLGRALGWWS